MRIPNITPERARKDLAEFIRNRARIVSNIHACRATGLRKSAAYWETHLRGTDDLIAQASAVLESSNAR